jgi:hypothetical protein
MLQVRTVLLAVSSVVLGVIGGVLWSQLADPGRWEVRETGLVLTEEASRGQFSVIVVFTLIGAIAALVWAAATTALLRSGGWPLVLLVVVGTTAAALVAWQVGMFLGPPAPQSVSGLMIGDRVPDQLRVDGIAPFLVWPIAGLVGVLLSAWGRGWRDDEDYADDERAIGATTASVADTRS